MVGDGLFFLFPVMRNLLRGSSRSVSSRLFSQTGLTQGCVTAVLPGRLLSGVCAPACPPAIAPLLSLQALLPGADARPALIPRMSSAQRMGDSGETWSSPSPSPLQGLSSLPLASVCFSGGVRLRGVVKNQSNLFCSKT